jgi:hypothetical protein
VLSRHEALPLRAALRCAKPVPAGAVDRTLRVMVKLGTQFREIKGVFPIVCRNIQANGPESLRVPGGAACAGRDAGQRQRSQLGVRYGAALGCSRRTAPVVPGGRATG